MESYIPISQLNDFIFCPKSIYLHNLYGRYSQRVYHETPQKAGTLAHTTIDQGTYSTKKAWLQGLEIYSEDYCLCGKIDLYNTEAKILVERKRRIKTIYDGYRYQVWAQYFCLMEMGYPVEKVFLHSLVDNRRYAIPVPGKEEKAEFEDLLERFHAFQIDDPSFSQNPKKCAQCIYRELCDTYSNSSSLMTSSHAVST